MQEGANGEDEERRQTAHQFHHHEEQSEEIDEPQSAVGLDEPRRIGLKCGERAFIREVLAAEVDLGAVGTEFVPRECESRASLRYRLQLGRDGAPSEIVAAGYRWSPGTELADPRVRESAVAPILKATGS